ncbi:MAG: hypothetical protein R3E34_14625, partial [Rhodocyclaceae bacterium]
ASLEHPAWLIPPRRNALEKAAFGQLFLAWLPTGVVSRLALIQKSKGPLLRAFDRNRLGEPGG